MRKFILRNLIYFLLGKAFLKYKNDLNTKNILEERIKNNKEKSSYVDKPKDYFTYKTKESYYENMQVFSWNEKNKHQPVIFYFHGGGFISQPTKYHYKFLNYLIKITDCKIIMPIYPKIPKSNYFTAMPRIKGLYSKLQDEIDKNSDIYLIGDSSGATIILNLLLDIKNNGLINPKKVILLSPWIDLNIDNNKIEKYDKKDAVLHIQSLNLFRNYWVQSNNKIKSPFINPMYGNFQDTSHIITITSDREIFYPDVYDFHKKLSSQDIDNDLIIEAGLFHGFMIMPIKEQKKTIEYISKLICT